VVTHDVRGTKFFSDRLVVLHEGHIVSEGTIEELERSREKFVVQFLSEVA